MKKRKVDNLYHLQYQNIKNRIETQIISEILMDEVILFFKKAKNTSYHIANMHILEDLINTRFIKLIANNMYVDHKTVVIIADKISQINECNYLKWYD